MKIGNICNHSFLEDYISSSSCVLDCGVNRGEFSSQIYQKSHCVIHGFEPDPRLFPNLPNIEKCTFYQLAISDKSGLLKLNLGESMCSSLFFSENNLENHCLVETISLPEFCELKKITNIDLLKLDIEGAELIVFDSLKDDFIENKLSQITVEFHEFIDITAIPKIKKIIARLRELGFYYFPFSMTYGDILFVNKKFIKLSLSDRIYIIFIKYKRGLGRIIKRINKKQENCIL